jgi:hypothetical protein
MTLAPSVSNIPRRKEGLEEHACPAHLRLTSPDWVSESGNNYAGPSDEEHEEREEARELAKVASEAKKIADREARYAAQVARRAEMEAARAERSRKNQEKARAGKKVGGFGRDFDYGRAAKPKEPKAPRVPKPPKTKPRPEGGLDTDEAIAYLTERGYKRSKAGLSNARVEGRLKSVRCGRVYYHTPAGLDAYIAACKLAAKAAGERARAARIKKIHEERVGWNKPKLARRKKSA